MVYIASVNQHSVLFPFWVLSGLTISQQPCNWMGPCNSIWPMKYCGVEIYQFQNEGMKGPYEIPQSFFPDWGNHRRRLMLRWWLHHKVERAWVIVSPCGGQLSAVRANFLEQELNLHSVKPLTFLFQLHCNLDYSILSHRCVLMIQSDIVWELLDW